MLISKTNEHSEQGAGIIAALVGTTIFIVLLGFAAQILLGLYAGSVVTAAGWDAARRVAQSPIYNQDTIDSAETHARSSLGSYGNKTNFDWSQSTPDEVVLTIRTQRPIFLPSTFRQSLPSADITRKIRVRREQLQS